MTCVCCERGTEREGEFYSETDSETDSSRARQGKREREIVGYAVRLSGAQGRGEERERERERETGTGTNKQGALQAAC